MEKSEAKGGRLARVALDERGLQSLADEGDASAQHALGAMYSCGRGVAKDGHEAVAWWRKSAEQGYAEAQCDLGEAYQDGEGVDKNLNEAAGWSRKSAEQGHAQAQCALGFAYCKGEGVDKNLNEALDWWLKSAESREANASEALLPVAMALYRLTVSGLYSRSRGLTVSGLCLSCIQT